MATSRVPFNRTSMESKQKWFEKVKNEAELLIEPVWNRNVLFELLTLRQDILLIEPVWNRNINL